MKKKLECVRCYTVSIRPTIRNGKITDIEVGNIQFSVINDISLEELPKIIEAITYLQTYINFSSTEKGKIPRNDWNSEEIIDFLNNRNNNQITFFKILTERGEILRADLVKEMDIRLDIENFSGLSLAGILAGIGIRTNRLNKEPLYKKLSKKDGIYYTLNDKFANTIEEWLISR